METGSRSLLAINAPTCVLLKPDKTFFAFGFYAEERYEELTLDGEEDDWYFFKGFKMPVYNNETLSRSTELSDVSGKKLPAQTVFSHGIRFLMHHLLNFLNKRTPLEERDILWVLTVPAMWNNNAKQFIREAAAQAGIEENHLMIALEPKAAALYCRILPEEKCDYGRNLASFKPGSKFMVADLGGETVDITVLEVLDKNNFRELHKASGGAWGGTMVDENFMQMIANVVGGPVMKRFQKEFQLDNLDLIREFQMRTIRPDSTGNTRFRIPLSLIDVYEKEHGKNIRIGIAESNFATQMRLSGNKLIVNTELVKQLFIPFTDNVVKQLKDVFRNPVCRDVYTILMVGDFSEYAMVQEAIKSNFKDKRVIIPKDPGLAVVKGAVLFGHMSI